MGTLLIKNADVLACMDEQGREIRNGSLFIRDNIIEQVGDTPNTADCVLDMRGHVVLPGLVNTHHHLFQSLTRATPGAQDGSLSLIGFVHTIACGQPLMQRHCIPVPNWPWPN